MLKSASAQTSAPRPPATKDWLALIFLAALWGCAFLFIKRALVVYSPVQLSLWRLSLATLTYLPIGLFFWSKINFKKWKAMVAVSLFGSGIPSVLYGIGQQHVNSSTAGVLNSLAPLFTFLLGVLLFGLTFHRSKLYGVLLGLGGAVLLVISAGQGGSKAGGGASWYALLCIIGTLCYAINANIIRAYLQDEHPAALAAGGFMLSGPFFFLGLYWSGGIEVFQNKDGLSLAGLDLGTDTFPPIYYILYLAVVSTALSSILYFKLLQRTGPVFATTVTYLIPLVAVALGLLDGEVFGVGEMIGTAILLSGLYLLRKG